MTNKPAEDHNEDNSIRIPPYGTLRIVYTDAAKLAIGLQAAEAALANKAAPKLVSFSPQETSYLATIINSNAFYAVAATAISGRGREVAQLNIPEFDPKIKLHMVILRAGERATAKLAELNQDPNNPERKTSRRELGESPIDSPEGKEVEAAVDALLGRGVDFRGIFTVDPNMRFGKPCIRGIRMTPFDVMEYLAGGENWPGILHDFPFLTETDLYACLSFAAAEDMDDDYARLRKAVI